MTTATRQRPPARTPWGTPQDVRELAPGIWLIVTAGHGGVWLDPVRQAEIPREARAATWGGRGRVGWYEEDVDMLIPMYRWPGAFARTFPTATPEKVRASLAYWNPEALAALEALAEADK